MTIAVPHPADGSHGNQQTEEGGNTPEPAPGRPVQVPSPRSGTYSAPAIGTPGFHDIAPSASGVPWHTHAHAMIDEWMRDFTWDHTPLSHFVSGIDAAINGAPAHPLWRSGVPTRHLPAGPPPQELPSADTAPFNMRHPLWAHLVQTWQLRCTWLHPETTYTVEPLAFAENRASLLIGCTDRNAPAAPRRYDPQRDPLTHDMGVIAFPLRPFRALQHHLEGHVPEAAMLLCAGTAVAESAVHEALEMHQHSPGIPVLDPHAQGVTVDIVVHWAPGQTPTTGRADAA
ncbi:hypothetical protein [Streptomyces mobaraensis]|uniref:Uncharacterized protein n=1 Tax=Streptomyces mobaraensis TaxID=35621 RepID=A0A5N5W1M5_STRMB|nr:hypothetical protein [Streptomyces mobaraensis]KAB7835788.1 hypothetical protein FRZ00_26615 [Streptomyces mobaraensis]